MDESIPPLSDRELLVRIDAKLDGVIEDKKDHEARIRALEEKVGHFITGKHLTAGLGFVLAAASAASPVINWLTHH